MGLGGAWAGAAGACAAASAIFAKLAANSETWEYKAVCYAIVVLCNVSMWSLYVRSLTSLSSLQATVVNFGSNFLLSGFAGFVVFSEPAHYQWFVGASLILVGIWIVSKSSSETDDIKRKSA